MTVRELRKALFDLLDQDMLVVVRRGEAGYDTVRAIRKIQVEINGNLENGERVVSCFGEHDDVFCSGISTPVVLIDGEDGA